MSLKKYHAKRNFSKTAEPRGKRTSAKKEKIFVVQEHHARRLHYDFRLEAEGTLKSWAVPKGPSLDPKQKRLAVQVEDHPLDYASFEGSIPKGEYGAGDVKIWDRGTWIPLKPVREGLRKGRLEFELFGKKLRGKWVLLRLRNNNEKKVNWLLIKMKDVEARTPHFVEPQLAQLVSTAPVGDTWIHELKYDGYRTFLRIDENTIRFLTRSGLDWTDKYRALIGETKKIPCSNAVIDGELVWIDERGHSDFQGLQQALQEEKFDRIVYYAFDILFLNGQDLREHSLLARKKILQNLLHSLRSSKILYSQHWQGNGQKIYEEACREGLEGIVSKDGSSSYLSGRGKSWQKIKCSLRQEMVIGGYAESEAGRSFRALLMGIYDPKGKLQYIGKVGTGFSDATLHDLHKKIVKIERKNSPFEHPPREKGLHWVEPKLVGEVEYKSWTAEKLLRQAAFKGLRLDKKAKEIRLETPKTQLKVVPNMDISSPKRIVYTKARITKLEVAEYYKAVAPLMLPYLQNRPLSLVRCQENTSKPCFFQKHVNQMNTPGINSNAIENAGKKDTVITINSLEGLMGLIQWGAIEIHGWGSIMPQYKNPDVIVFDLDPETPALWNEVVYTARVIRNFLQQLGLESFVKVTGGKGLHIHVPIEARYSWEEIKGFSQAMMNTVAMQEPEKYTLKMSKAKRGGKIFLDYLRNGYGATAVQPYSLRARREATVALPIHWDELKKSVHPDAFTLKKVLTLIKRREDPWERYFSLRQNIRSLDSLRKLSA